MRSAEAYCWCQWAYTHWHQQVPVGTFSKLKTKALLFKSTKSNSTSGAPSRDANNERKLGGYAICTKTVGHAHGHVLLASGEAYLMDHGSAGQSQDDRSNMHKNKWNK